MQIRSHDLALCSWSLPSGGMQQLVASLRTLGLSHSQLALEPLLFLDDKQKHLELGHLRASGINLTAGMIYFPGEDYSTIARIHMTGGFLPDETWTLRRQLTLQAAKLAHELGLSILTTHIGFIPPSDHADYSKLLERIAEIASALAPLNILLAMETGQETAPGLLQFLNDLPVRNIGVNFDPANMILYGAGDPIEAIHTLGRHIRHVHLKDAIPSDIPGTNWGHQTPLGAGKVDFPELLAALNTVGYAGPLAIEQESGHRRLEDIQSAIQFLQTL